jgi:hypothetical protein
MTRSARWQTARQGKLTVILALCGDENGESLLSLPSHDEGRVVEEATEFIPASPRLPLTGRKRIDANLDAVDARSTLSTPPTVNQNRQ